jgi:Tol biopolymer transport system component
MRPSRLDLTVIAIATIVILTVVASLFLIQPPSAPLRVAYLSPALRAPQNIWVADLTDPDSAKQVTFSLYGIYDFAPSADGRYIAYAERQSGDVGYHVDLFVVDVLDNSTQRLTFCAEEGADCTTPTWRADNGQIAYMRRNPDILGDGSLAPPKIWLIDNPLSATRDIYNMFNDNQTTGSGPLYSADGRRLAFYENIGRGVLVFDFNPPTESDRIKFIPADNGATGTLSPNGERLITSTLVMSGDSNVRSALIVANLVDGTLSDLLPDGQSSDGISAAWHPSGDKVAITRQYQDATRYTNGQQVYEVDLTTQILRPLLVDDAYTHGSIAYSPDGGALLVQRYELGGAAPGIWVLDLTSQTLTEIVADAYLPAWVPALTP